MHNESLISGMSNWMDCGAVLLRWGSLGSRICFCHRQVLFIEPEKNGIVYISLGN